MQDIEDQVGAMVNHTLPEPPHALAHDGSRGALLETLMRERLEGDTCAVTAGIRRPVRSAKDSWPAPPPPTV